MNPQNMTGPHKANMERFDPPQVVDEKTIRFTAKEIHWKNLMAAGDFYILCKHAYEKKDLLQLLELQLEAEQIDQEHLNNIAEDRLKYFIKILKEQLFELEQEVAIYEQQFNARMKRPIYSRLNPKTMMMTLERDIRSLRHDIGNLKADIEIFENRNSLKAFLKSYKIQKKRPVDDFDDFLDDFLHPENFR